MKHIILFITIVIMLFIACKKETTSTTPINETPEVTAIAIDSGFFSNGPYGSVTGRARIYKTGGNYELALENFSSSNGPDLKVYLSKEKQPVNFVNLGSLKSTAGNQLYCHTWLGQCERLQICIDPLPAIQSPLWLCPIKTITSIYENIPFTVYWYFAMSHAIFARLQRCRLLQSWGFKK